MSYVDATAADPPVTKGTTMGTQVQAITTATTTDCVAAPAAGLRNVKWITICNKHASTSCDVTVVFNRSGTQYQIWKVTLVAGATLEFSEEFGWFVVQPLQATQLLKILSADDTGGTNVATAQPWFPTAGGVSVTADTTYIIDAHWAATRTAGTTAHTTGILFAGTATLTSIMWTAVVNSGDVETNAAGNRTTARVATNTTIKASSTSATEAIDILFHGAVRINAAGTFIPQFIYSAAPGGTPTIKANSWFRMVPVGNGSFTSQGTWA